MIRLVDLLHESAISFRETEKERDEDGLVFVEYRFIVGETTYRVEISSMDTPGYFEASFGVHGGDFNKIDTFELTGEGRAQTILHTVAEILNNFYSRYKAEVEAIEIAGTSEKRSRIYKNFLPRYLSSDVSKVVIFK